METVTTSVGDIISVLNIIKTISNLRVVSNQKGQEATNFSFHVWLYTWQYHWECELINFPSQNQKNILF